MAGNTNTNRIDWHEINRKIIHIIGGLFLCALVYIDAIRIWMIVLAIGAGMLLSIAYRSHNVPVIHYFLNKFEREHLKKKFPGKGVIYLFVALFILMISFEKNVVIAGLLIWTFGDSISAIVGKHYGSIRHPLNNARLIEGTIAGIMAATIAASFFTYWLYALIGSTIAMIIESIDWKLYQETLDDNLLVPVIGAFVIQMLILIF